MIRLEIRSFNMILMEKLQKYQPCHQVKLISMTILQVTKYCLLIKKNNRTSKFNYSPFQKHRLITKQRFLNKNHDNHSLYSFEHLKHIRNIISMQILCFTNTFVFQRTEKFRLIR